MAKKFSQFPSAANISPGDSVVGLKDGANTRFSFATFLSSIQSLFVPTSRKINNKALTTDITLNASDVGAVGTADVGVANGVASLDNTGKVPGTQLDLDGKQDTITASGILKGDGAGGVSAATPGTDYGTYSKPSGGIPSTDMTSAVQTSLGKADTAYQKPSGGIPASDLASGVIPSVPSASTANPQMDGTASPGSSGEWADGGHVHPRDPKLDLHADGIPGATQAVTWDAYGNVTTVTHTVGGITVRTDIFSYTDSTITETRTLATGESLTLVTNLQTWATTETYAAA